MMKHILASSSVRWHESDGIFFSDQFVFLLTNSNLILCNKIAVCMLKVTNLKKQLICLIYVVSTVD